jgi:hypothetical protein
MNAPFPTMPVVWHWLDEEEGYAVDYHTCIEKWLQEMPVGTEVTVYETVECLKSAIENDLASRPNRGEYFANIVYNVYECGFKCEVNALKTPLEYFSDTQYNRTHRRSHQPLLIHRISELPELMDEPFDIRYRRI